MSNGLKSFIILTCLIECSLFTYMAIVERNNLIEILFNTIQIVLLCVVILGVAFNQLIWLQPPCVWFHFRILYESISCFFGNIKVFNLLTIVVSIYILCLICVFHVTFPAATTTYIVVRKKVIASPPPPPYEPPPDYETAVKMRNEVNQEIVLVTE